MERALCWHAMPQDLEAPWTDAFLGKKWVSVWKVVGFGLQASNMVCLSSAMCAGKILGFIASFVSLQTFHETNVYL